jgi:hypothetical protein
MDYTYKIADEYIHAQYFFNGIDDFLKKHKINDAITIKNIKLQVIEIEKIYQQNNNILDLMLKTMRSIKLINVNEKRVIIYHPSTRERNKFQISFFYNNMPTMHLTKDTILDVKKELIGYINSNFIYVECIVYVNEKSL